MSTFARLKNPCITFVIVMLGMLSITNDARAQSGTDSLTFVKIQIDGLSCPFCAYGLEKGLKKITGVGEVFISVKDAYTTFHVPKNRQPSVEELKKIINDAGFDARKVEFSKEPFSMGKD